MNSELTDIEKAVLGLVSRSLFNVPCRVNLSGEEWMEVYRECNSHAVQLLCYDAAAECGLPEDVSTLWKQSVIAVTAGNVRVDYMHAEIGRLMRQAEIPYVILKGCASASYYPDPLKRTMGDVDFYIDPSDSEKAAAFLQTEGAVMQKKTADHHIGFTFDEQSIEMHTSVNGLPDGELRVEIGKLLQELLQDSATIDNGCGTICVPSDFHHGLIILLHTARHLLSSGIGLRHLCDWAVFVNSVSDRYPGLFDRKLEEIGLKRFADTLTAACVRNLGLPPEPWMTEIDEDTADALTADILHAGNFGNKKSEIRDDWFVTQISHSGINEEGILKTLWERAGDRAERLWEPCRTSRLLLFFGRFAFCIRYLFLILTGKKKIVRLGKLKKTADVRLELYRELKIFAEEEA